MPGCGYICPKCNDTGLDEDLKSCDWCSPLEKPKTEISTEDWLKAVHEGPCCGDLGMGSKEINPDCSAPLSENGQKPSSS